MIRLLLIDDHALFREGVGRLLAGEADLEVVRSCSTLLCGRKALSAEAIDIVLLDFDLGASADEGGTIEFVRYCRSARPDAKILILTAGVGERDAADLIGAGVAGIFHKHNDPQMLSSRIRSVYAGNVFLEEVYLKSLFQMARPESAANERNLTERERAVLDGVLEGLSNKLIADRVGATEAAVKGTVQQLFQKAGVRTRSQLVRFALEHFR